MRRIIGIFVWFSLLLNLSFMSYASEHLISSDGGEYQEILSMRDDVLYHINYGGARTELNRDVARASNSYNQSGIGGEGLSYKKNIFGKKVF